MPRRSPVTASLSSQLKIKTGVVQRTLKELLSYQKEVDDNKSKVAQIRAGTDHSRLKQWEQVLGETQAMVPDTTHRLSTAVTDLSLFIEQLEPADKQAIRAADIEKANIALSSATTAIAHKL